MFDEIITYILSNRKHSPIVAELFVSGKKLNIYIAFIAKSHFAVPKNIILYRAHCFIKKILCKQ